jgi:hypothetical protein
MWLFAPFGFFSIVEKQKGDTLTIRARVRRRVIGQNVGILSHPCPIATVSSARRSSAGCSP